MVQQGEAAFRMAFDPSFCFDAPLLDLGDIEPELSGILVPEPEVGREKVGVSDQFLAEAQSYHDRNVDVAVFRGLIRNALERIGWSSDHALILDVGSGSGRTVLPCLDLIDKSTIVATDISPNLLKILQRTLASTPGYQDRVAMICMDATRDRFRTECFDLAMGAAILHHLIDPKAALVATGKALKPGGRAIFFEPFENGNGILYVAYTEIVRRAEGGSRIEPSALVALNAFLRDYEARSNLTSESPMLQILDDKWLFTRTFFEESAKAAGFGDVLIYPLHPIEKPFTQKTEIYLRLAGDLKRDSLDDWAWEILAFYDAAFSENLKHDLLIEGTVILSKA